MREYEDPVDSCRAICWFLAKAEGTSKAPIRESLLSDLLWKARDLPKGVRNACIAPGLFGCLPTPLRTGAHTNGYEEFVEPSHSHRKRVADVGLVTILGAELDAALLGLGLGRGNDQSFDGHRYWLGEVDRVDRRPLSIVLSRAERPRNVPMAIHVAHLLSQFQVDLLMVIGIAAGPEEYVNLGDVVVSLAVYDYEHVRSEIRNGKPHEGPRPWWQEVTQEVRRDVNEVREQYSRTVHDLVRRLGDDAVNRGVIQQLRNRTPKIHAATIAAGERLFADGSLAAMCRYDQEIRAGDQEDSGFAQASQFYKKPWVCVRGIADFGDPDKDKTWHEEASIAAAATGLVFLRNAYRSPADAEF